MKFTLTGDLFTNNEYSVSYGLKKATFSIVDEAFTASGGISAVIGRMLLTIITYSSIGELVSEEFGCLVIGLGDDNVAVTSSTVSLLGKLMTRDNMSSCSVELYE